MRRLIITRHAKTEPYHPSGEDHARALVGRGRDDAAAAARLLADLGLHPRTVLVSTAERTRQTWDIMSETLEAGEVVFDDDLYLASAEALLAHVSAAPRDGDIMIIGHNPGVRELAALLTNGAGPHALGARARLAEGLPTGWSAIVASDGPFAYGAARLAALIGPERQG